MPVLKTDSKLFIAGHRGLVGSAILRRAKALGFNNIVVRTRSELDLFNQKAVYDFLESEQPDAVILAAARVGGIHANSTAPAQFINENLIIEHNVIWGSHRANVPLLLFLGSSCVYPRDTAQPISEDALLSGKPEPTNAPFAIAKIAGIFLCDAITKQFGRRYFSAMLPNIFGINDNFDLASSHVLPALIRKFHEALPDSPVECWGTGTPRREFLLSDEVADALLFLMQKPEVTGHINIGCGKSVSIQELAETIQRVVGHRGPIHWNTKMPDGFPEKTMAVERLNTIGWKSQLSLEEGIRTVYDWYREQATIFERKSDAAPV